MVLEFILTKLLGLSGHLLLGRYQTTLIYKFHTRVKESRHEEGVLEIPRHEKGVLEILHLLKIRYFNSL